MHLGYTFLGAPVSTAVCHLCAAFLSLALRRLTQLTFVFSNTSLLTQWDPRKVAWCSSNQQKEKRKRCVSTALRGECNRWSRRALTPRPPQDLSPAQLLLQLGAVALEPPPHHEHA